jgi:NADPH-dependent curcumin reductase CurA
MSTATQNQCIVLASRPSGAVTLDNFRLESRPIPTVGPGQVLVRNHYLSLDPYMRGRMGEGKSYSENQPLDQVMLGGTVGEVIESAHPQFAVGDYVSGFFGWQLYGLSDGKGLSKVDTSQVPLSAYLGIVGMPGVTAWHGLHRICEPQPGQTVVVSAASGAVGSVVGQLAKLAGCRAVGIAGGAAKCQLVVDELGFDACIDYKAGNLTADLHAATPQGIDCYFENVGGEILDAVLGRMNAFGRIALCGMIAGYNGLPIPLRNPVLLLVNRLKLQGFIVSEHPDSWPPALKALSAGVRSGQLKYRESIADGLPSAPQAFIGMLDGKNVGKQLVKLI